MNWFDVFFLMNVLAILCALVRARPAILILAANQAITLRAISNIDRFGKPGSQEFLPDAVFSSANLQIAVSVFAITSSIALLFAVMPAIKRRADPALLPALPGWLMKSLIVYFIVLALSERTILSQGYSDPNRVVYSANFGGGTSFLNSLFIYEVVRRTLTGEMRRRIGFGFVLLVFLATDYFHGSTGIATGFVVVAAILIFSPEPRFRRTFTLAAILAGLLVLALSIRVLRSSLSGTGNAGLGRVATSVQESSAGESSNAQGVESMGNGTQYAAHVFECITLYEAGISREWRSVYLPIVYTFEPSFVIKPLGIERPKEAAWELAEYFIHGGGIFIVGEMYWNGGYLCVFVVFFALAWLCWKCDSGYQSGFVGLMMACHVAPNLLQGTGYGLAQVSRGIINGLLAILLWKLAQRLGLGRRYAVPATG